MSLPPKMTDIEKLEQAISALEAQRAVLGDAVVETALGSLREKLLALHTAETSAVKPGEAQQRKIITVLFASLPGLEERLDAEDLRDAINTLWEQLDDIIMQHGGRIDKHMGSGVMALWGAEVVSEDDPEQAIRAALEMRKAVQTFCAGSPPFSASDIHNDLRLRAGINTGPAIVGSVGITGEFTAIGDTVNLAARLDQAANPDDILIAYDTYRLVRGVFDVEAQPPLTVKGKSEPVQTFRVLLARPRAFRILSRGVEGVETPLIARESELAELQAAFFRLFEQGRPQLFTITGDMGLGKSRLLHEFITWSDLRPELWWWFQGRSSPSQTASPYSLLRDLFTFRFEIQDNDSLATVQSKMEHGFAEFMPTEAQSIEKAHVVGQLLGFDFSSSPYLRGLLQDPKQMRSLGFGYLTRFFISAAQIHPVILLLDDIHWADTGSLDALMHILTNIPAGTPLLALCMARPALSERYPHWGENAPSAAWLNLKPLSRDDSRHLVEHILQKAETLPSALRELVVGGAEGNPFYLEELIKMLIDGKVIRPGEEVWKIDLARLDAFNIPPTLAGVLQARLDRLDAVERASLQRASVVGRVFWDSAIEALDPDLQAERERLQGSLSVLRTKELIFSSPVSTFSGTQEYSFKHALLRDVTYETVLKRQRAQYHARVADWLSSVSGERRAEYLPIIADHYEKAGENAKAVATLSEAGEQALGVSAFSEAFRFFQRALSLIQFDKGREATYLQLKIGEAFFRSGEYPDALKYSEKALAQARELTGGDLLANALYQVGQIQAEMGNYPLAEKHLEQALQIARLSGLRTQGTLARALYGLGSIHWRLGNLQKAQALCAESRDLAEKLNDMNTLLLALNRLGVLSGLMGDPVNEEQTYRRVLVLAVEVGNRERAAVALNNLGALADERSELKKAQDFYLQAMAMAREIGAQQSLALYLTNLAHSEIRLGDLENAQEHLSEGLALSHHLGAGPWTLTAVIFFARLEAARGNQARALELLGLAENHPAFSLDHRRLVEQMLAEWHTDAETIALGKARGAKLDWEQAVMNLMVS